MKCTGCATLLTPVQGLDDTLYQFDNALWVGFYGGYGMFVDDLDTEWGLTRPTLPGAASEAVLCHSCAHQLCQAAPWLAKLLQPELSHSHSDEYLAEHPEHRGWDQELAPEKVS